MRARFPCLPLLLGKEAEKKEKKKEEENKNQLPGVSGVVDVVPHATQQLDDDARVALSLSRSSFFYIFFFFSYPNQKKKKKKKKKWINLCMPNADVEPGGVSIISFIIFLGPPGPLQHQQQQQQH
jgi:hypothetical protein